MLRPNIWVEKIEKLPSRVEGWLRLSAARTRSDWSKTFPARFFENGRVEGGGGKGGGGATATESWPIWATTEYAALLRASDTFSQNSPPITASQPRCHKEYSLCRF